jgi:hypothetical protein
MHAWSVLAIVCHHDNQCRHIVYTHVPSYSDSVCLEQWIRAKYERKEFASESDMSKTPYTAGMYNRVL